MPLVRGDREITDEWTFVVADTPAPDTGDVVVPFARWPEERETLRRRDGRVGVVLATGDELEAIADDLTHLSLVALHFDSFLDGRHYSNARLLRERFGYAGELRATGEVFRDQVFYLARCGFDSYLLPDASDVGEFIQGLDDFSLVYQAAADGRTPAYRLRRV